MRKSVVAAGLAAAVLLGNACAFYHVKKMDPKVLAGTGPKGQIVGIRTAGESFAFPEDDPAVVRNGMVLGYVHMGCLLDPVDIVDISPGRLGPNVVLRDGTRFQSPDSRPEGQAIACEAVRTVCVPVDEVVGVDVRKLNGLASVLGTLAGAALFVAAVALDDDGESWFDDDDGGFADPGNAAGYRPSDFLGALLDDAGDTPERARRRSAGRALLGLKEDADPAGETEFWAVEWVPVEARPGADGTLVAALGNGSGVPRTVDEARLVVVDHPPGVRVAADALDAVRALAAPVPPDAANDGGGADVLAPLAAADGVLWRSVGGEAIPAGAASARDELTVGFPRPKGARRARLVVTAANSAWPTASTTSTWPTSARTRSGSRWRRRPATGSSTGWPWTSGRSRSSRPSPWPRRRPTGPTGPRSRRPSGPRTAPCCASGPGRTPLPWPSSCRRRRRAWSARCSCARSAVTRRL